jgi:hypothetical protein
MIVGSNPTSHPKIKERRMDTEGKNKVKAEIANLRRIANMLPPGTVKQALAKRAADLGKSISPSSLPNRPKVRGTGTSV